MRQLLAIVMSFIKQGEQQEFIARSRFDTIALLLSLSIRLLCTIHSTGRSNLDRKEEIRRRCRHRALPIGDR